MEWWILRVLYFLDYYLNNSKFGNAKALRNDYLHGSQKIDDDLALKDVEFFTNSRE